MPLFSSTSYVQITGGNFVEIGRDFNLQNTLPPGNVDHVLTGLELDLGRPSERQLIGAERTERRGHQRILLYGAFDDVWRVITSDIPQIVLTGGRSYLIPLILSHLYIALIIHMVNSSSIHHRRPTRIRVLNLNLGRAVNILVLFLPTRTFLDNLTTINFELTSDQRTQ
jgi:hypothetical protein